MSESTGKDGLELPPLPKPPRSLRVQGWVLSVGVLLLGVTAFTNSLVTYASFGLVKQEGEASACRSELAAEDQAALGNVTKGLADALVNIRGATPEDIEEMRANVASLIEASDEAAERRQRADEICGP